tara:strand:+ start:15189 stop:15923 length:735 start_codon:yes stop_codon:yes gene_type:complete
MGRVSGDTTRIYVDEFNFSGVTNAATGTFGPNLPEVTSFGDTGAEFVEGLMTSSISLGGFFDATDDAYDEQMFTTLGDGADHFVGFYPGLDAAQATNGYEIKAKPSPQTRPFDVAGAALLDVDWQGTGGVVRSRVLVNQAVTGTGAVSGSNQNLGATSSGTVFVALLRVLSITGGNITVVIEESSNDGGGDAYAAILSFANTAAIAVERLTTTNATEAWKRVNVTALTASTATILVVVGTEQGT